MSPPGGNPLANRVTKEQWDLFFERLESGTEVKAAAQLIGYHLTWIYRIKNADPAIAERWSRSLTISRSRRADKLEEIAMKRAKKGEAAILIFLLKRLRPEIYGDHHDQRKDKDKTLRIEDVDGYDKLCNGLLECLQPYPEAMRAVIAMLEEIKADGASEGEVAGLLN